MSLAEIEAELPTLAPEELRRLALKSWAVYAEKQGISPPSVECSEEDPSLLAALDRAVADADSNRGRGFSADEVQARLSEWTTR